MMSAIVSRCWSVAWLGFLAAGIVILVSFGASAQERNAIEHVVILGLDGARPDALQQGAGPVLKRLIASGTVCWNAQAELPSVTQVNWASTLTGSRPETHGIATHPVTREELAGMHLRVPTIFEVITASGGTTVAFLGHWKLYPVETGDPPRATFIHSPYEGRRVAPMAAAWIKEHRPTLAFIWMGDLDGVGHAHGWMSAEQIQRVTELDDAIGLIVESLVDAGMWDRTLLLISSDHGGSGRSHGEGTAEDRTIPWIAVGPGIEAGQVITREMSTCDTAPTALAALGLTIPEEWDGRPVSEVAVAREAGTSVSKE